MSNLRKIDIKRIIKHLILITLGNFVLAFGTVIFLTKLNIVAGGLSGIGIIFQYFLGSKFPGGQIIDIVVFILTWILWIIGFFLVGKEFAFKTLASSIIYPLALALFLRIPVFDTVASTIAYYPKAFDDPEAMATVGNLIICGLFGGIFVGTGVALTFLGGGSTGGIDVIIAIISKYTQIRESIVSFAIDGTIILFGMFLIPGNVVPSLCGFISAFMAALLIEYVYNSSMTSYQVDIISDKWELISQFAQDTLERGATIIQAKGGYKGDERIVLRIVFDRKQYIKLRNYIFEVDPKAFVTFTQTNAVYGEGFKTNKKIVKKQK